MFTARGGVAPPETHSSAPRRKFGTLEAKQMVHLLQNPLDSHVDPAPLRQVDTNGTEVAATARQVREALDRGVPAKRLFSFNRTLTASEVDFAIWDERWKPVVGDHRSPRRPTSLARPAARSALLSNDRLSTASVSAGRAERSRSPMGLNTTIPRPHPLPPPAYLQPIALLKDPGSVAKNRASKAAAAQRDAKLKAHEHRQAIRVAHRLPKEGEQWRAEALYSENATQRSGTAMVMRRWSRPADEAHGKLLESDSLCADATKSSWSVRSAPASARSWQEASGYVSTARGAGTACDGGSDLLVQMLGKRPAVTTSAPEPTRHHTESSLPSPRTAGGSPRSQYRHDRSWSPSRPEKMAAELMGTTYTPAKTAREWKALGSTPGYLKPRTPRMPSPPPDAAPEFWQTLHSEISSHCSGLSKKANVSFREGELEMSLRHLQEAIQAQHRVEKAAQKLALATKQAPTPDTADATAKLHALHALFLLRGGDTRGALEAAQSAIKAVQQDLGGDNKTLISRAGAMAHYRKATALCIESAQGGEMDPKGKRQLARVNSRVIDPRRQTKWEALQDVTAALRHAPADRRFKALFNRLWREAHTEFGYSSFREIQRSIPKRDDSESSDSEEEEEYDVKQPCQLDDAWRFLDLFDLFDHNQMLHEATTRLLGDGSAQYEEGSTKDLSIVLNLLRRTHICPADMKKAEQMLKGKTLPLEPEARELLRQLRPLDAADDHKKLIDFLIQEQGYLRIIFRQYALMGSGDIDLLGLNPFRQLCKDIKLSDKRKSGVSKQTFDTIFTRANRYNSTEVLTSSEPRSGGVDSFDSQLLRRVQPGIDNWSRNYELNASSLRQPEFVAALIRCAFKKFAPGIPSLHKQFKQLYDQHIVPNAGMPATDEIIELLATPEMRAVFSEDEDGGEVNAATVTEASDVSIAARVRREFEKLCKKNNEDNHDESEANTVNMDTFQDWVREHGLLNKDFTASDCRRIFVHVNLDDEINVQAESYDTPTGLTLSEFHECLVRVCVELAGKELQRDANGSIVVQSFLARLIVWIEKLLPTIS